MTSASPSMSVEEELKCPICMEYLTDPVTLDCGHNVCRGCITEYCVTWEDLGNLECPLCKARIKKGNFRPNWQLANIVEKIKVLPFKTETGAMCERHNEKLNLFCKEDEELVCLFCERSPEHRSHTVILLEEAAVEYKLPLYRSHKLYPSTEIPPAMTSAPPSMGVEEELKCPICKEDLSDPVILDCGHNFCKGCITHYCVTWEDLGGLQCPLCKARIKKGNFRPNWVLANIVEKIKLLPLNLGKEDLCAKHKEKLNLFCKEDEKLVCVICGRSPEHRSHTVLLLEEAAKKYESPFRRSLESLKKERKKILANQTDTEKESQDLLAQTKAERETIVAEFRQLRQFLEEEENRLLARLEELEEKIVRRRDEHLVKVFQELSSLGSLIWQVEEKCRQPPSDLLKDVRGTLQRCEKRKTFEDPVAFPPVMNWRNSEICGTSLRIKGVIKEFKENLLSQLHSRKANVTLDPDTVYTSHLQPQPLASMEVGNRYQGLYSHLCRMSVGLPPIDPSLANSLVHSFLMPHTHQCILSEDRKSVKAKERALLNFIQIVPFLHTVLGCEEFTTGKHFWEIVVGSAGGWAVGVARKSVKRKYFFFTSLEGEIWAVGKWKGEYIVVSPSHQLPLALSQEPERIRVTLDCDEGKVAFFDADSGVRIYTCSGAPLCGKTLHPFFYVTEGAHLTLSP